MHNVKITQSMKPWTMTAISIAETNTITCEQSTYKQRLANFDLEVTLNIVAQSINKENHQNGSY